MTIDNSDIEASKQVVTRAVEKYQTDRAALFAHDGKTPIDPPATFAAKQAKLLESVEWAVERAATLADKVTQETESQRLAPHADPTGQLSPAELQDANARAVWVREDCESLPLGDLVERLKAVAAGGSKSSQWLHWRYAKQRWTRESAKSPQDPALSAFGETLRNLGIVGPKAGLSDEAQKRLDKAQSLKMFAGSQLRFAQTGVKPGAGGPKINF